MSEEVLLYERVGKVGKVILNRPKVRNALNQALVEGFGDAIRKADADPETNVIVLCAAGEGVHRRLRPEREHRRADR